MRKWSLAAVVAALALSGCGESSLVRGTVTDRTPPTVTATEPANGAENVTEARVSITFSEPMATNTVQVRANPGLTWGTGTWSNADRTVTFIPQDMRPNTTYTLTVTGLDRAGNSMQQAYTFRFTTGALVQSGAVAEGVLRGKVLAGTDERAYAVFLAYVVGAPERTAAGFTEDQKALRAQVEQSAPGAVGKVREFFRSRQVTVQELAEYSLWLGPDFQLLRAPQPVQGVARTPAQPASPPAPASPVPASPAPASPLSPSPAPTASPQAPQPTPSPSSRNPRSQPVAGPAAAPAQAATPAAPTGNGVVQRLSGLDDVVRELYQEAKGRDLWQKAQEAHQREAAQLRDASEDRLRQAATYLRISAVPFDRLVLVPNQLAPKDSVVEVPLAGAVHVYVGPSSGPNVRGVLRAFLRQVLGAVVHTYRDLTDLSVALHDLVKQEADARGWTDWQAVVRESLVRAVEARLALPNQDERNQYLDAAFSEGLVLVHHFAQRLGDLERGQVNLARFVEESLRNVNVPQVRQQWQGRRR
jgi:hypothetical protein